jgi:hypothetical protein
MKQNSKEVIPDLATDEAAWLEKAKEQAHEKSTGTSSMTAPCEAYVQTVPGIPLWPGVRIGGLYSKRDIILPPVDIEEEFKRRLMMHRIEQREYWANKLNKGIMFGVALMVVGVIIKLWAKLSVGARIFFYGAGFACFCIACQWYFDYIPYIAVGFLGFIIFDMAWSVYSDKKSKTVKDELAGTVETVKEKIREKDLGHLWEEVKEDLSHGKSTIEHVKSYKSDVKAVTKKAVAKAVESIK